MPNTVRIQSDSILSGREQSRLEHALRVAAQTFQADAKAMAETEEKAIAAMAADPDAALFITPEGAKRLREEFEQYVEETENLIEKIDRAFSVAFMGYYNEEV